MGGLVKCLVREDAMGGLVRTQHVCIMHTYIHTVAQGVTQEQEAPLWDI